MAPKGESKALNKGGFGHNVYWREDNLNWRRKL